MKQCIFVDDWKNVHSGILLDNGSVLCGCCGGTIEAEDFRLLKLYDYWVSLDEAEIADRCDLVLFRKEIEKSSDDEFYEWFEKC